VKNKPLIYIAGKYTDITPEAVRANVNKAVEAARILEQHGWVIFVPHIHYLPLDLHYNDIMEQCKEMIQRCDAIFMLDNWKSSKGANIELIEARSIGLPVFCENEGYPTINEYYNFNRG
jgi:hypothetical protein